ncbi:MAG: S-adenosylmethionine:tRNA ribosyltransferase-isomerase, partial [Planctomycetota bacterium]
MTELDQYDYDLPRELVAQEPLRTRSDARLLVVDRGNGLLQHRYVRDLPEILRRGDCLVLNDTRVLPARLVGRRATTGGRWEGLFLEQSSDGLWRVIGKTRGRLRSGDRVVLVDNSGHDNVELIFGSPLGDGEWAARPTSEEPVLDVLKRVGRVPLPPYIRKGEMIESDRDRYQTVYAEKPGAVAAPTAGLHFTERLLAQMVEQGVEVARLTLHVGQGTFRPIGVDRLEDHVMHSE